jgi:hypothetical protein
MMTNATNELELSARIRQLEHHRGELWSIAGGAGFAARVCREVLNGEREPSQEMLARAGWSPVQVRAAYQERLAERLTVNLLARSQAKAITFELRVLRGLSTKRCPEAA